MKPTAAVVLGGLAAYIGYALSPEWTRLEVAELFVATSTYGVLILIGLSVGTYGLFYGIESAIVAGSDSKGNHGTSE